MRIFLGATSILLGILVGVPAFIVWNATGGCDIDDTSCSNPVAVLVVKAVTWIGMILVTFIAAFTPYNDYVLQNTSFIGNHFPIGIISLMAALILLVNPALMLLRWKPLATGELVVIMTMMMVGAAAPSSGLMRYLEPMLVSPYWLVKDFPF